MADRTRLNREIAGQHGTGPQAKTPGRETKQETEEPHAFEGEQPASEQAADQQTAEQQGRGRSVFDAPLQADLDAQRAADDGEPPPDET